MDHGAVGRECPGSDELRRRFRTEISRVQRRSDGTVTALGARFELPSAYRTARLAAIEREARAAP